MRLSNNVHHYIQCSCSTVYTRYSNSHLLRKLLSIISTVVVCKIAALISKLISILVAQEYWGLCPKVMPAVQIANTQKLLPSMVSRLILPTRTFFNGVSGCFRFTLLKIVRATDLRRLFYESLNPHQQIARQLHTTFG